MILYAVCGWKVRGILQIICKWPALLKNDKRKNSFLASFHLKDGSGFFSVFQPDRQKFLLEVIFGAVCLITLVHMCVGVGGKV